MTENIQEKIEDKIIDCINSGVAGRLIIFKPEKKGFEDYLAVERRGNYKEKEIYFQINSLVGPVEGSNFVKDFAQESFKSDKNFCLLFVYFNEITQKINDYIWLLPSSQFRDIAEVVKSPENKNLLRFEAPLDAKQKNKYSKFIVNIKDLGKFILEALEKDGKFNFKESFGSSLGEKKEAINLETLKDFLCEARKNTYAANNQSIDNPRLLASTQLEFQKGDYVYRDIFFTGDKRFIGQEIIYQNSKPIWGMNYIGTAQGAPISKLETAFLKESLLKLAGKCRMGGGPSGSCEYERREFKYQDHGQGNLDEFSGKEEIFSEGKSIYKLIYHGGSL